MAHRVGDGLGPDPQQRGLHRGLHLRGIAHGRIDADLRLRVAAAQPGGERGPVQGRRRQGTRLRGREHPDHRAQVAQRRMRRLPGRGQGTVAREGILERRGEAGVQGHRAEMPCDHVVQVMGDRAALGLHRMGGAGSGELVLEAGQMLGGAPGVAVMAHLPAPQQRGRDHQRREEHDDEHDLAGRSGEHSGEHREHAEGGGDPGGRPGQGPTAVHDRDEQRLEQQEVRRELPADDDLGEAQGTRHREGENRESTPPQQAHAGQEHQHHRDSARPGTALEEESGIRDARGREHDDQQCVEAHREQVPRLDRRGRRGGVGGSRRRGHAPRVRRERPTGRGRARSSSQGRRRGGLPGQEHGSYGIPP